MKLSHTASSPLVRVARRGSAFAAAGVVLAALATGGQAAGAAGAGAATAACQMSGLSVSVGSPNGAAGTIYYTIGFKNVSGAACTLRGYPVVVALSKSGKQLGSPARHASGTVKTVTLKPGKAATAALGVTEAGNFPSSVCGKIVSVAQLRITLHGTKLVRFSSPGCSKGSAHYTSVGPVS